MLPEFEFELLAPRSPGPLMVMALVLAFSSLLAAASFAWHSHAALVAAQGELKAARERSAAAAAAAASQSLPPYYADAVAALKLLQWPFDESLDEMEKCLPDDGQVESIHIDALARHTTTVLALSFEPKSNAFDTMLDCLNDEAHDASWRVTTVQRKKSPSGSGNVNGQAGDSVNAMLIINLERVAR